MKVAFVVDAFPVWSETFVLNQIAGVIARGHAVDIYACSRTPKVHPVVIPTVERYRLEERVRYLGAPKGALPRLLAAGRILACSGWRAPGLCARALNGFRYPREALTLRLLCATAPFLMDRPGNYDVIHCQFGPLGRIAMRLRQIGALRGALVTAFRGYDATKYLRRYPHAYDELFRAGDLFVPVSEALKRVLVLHGADAGKIEVHHSGIDCRKFSFQPRTRTGGEPTRVVSVARLVEKKGIEFAIRAVARLIERGRPITYDVIGDGERRGALQELITRLDMKAHIRLLGWRAHHDVAALLQQMHVLVAPSVTALDGDQEGIANALKEAMAVGMPVVATTHGGTEELVDDGISGFLVPERDVDALADRLGYLIDHPERWPEMGRAGRAKVEAAFDLGQLDAQLEQIYQRLVVGSGARASHVAPWTACAKA